MHSNEGEDSDSTAAVYTSVGASGLSTLGRKFMDAETAARTSSADKKTGAAVGDVRRVEITLVGGDVPAAGDGAWLAGKLLEHAAGMAGDAFLQHRELEATITIGARSTTVKVSR